MMLLDYSQTVISNLMAFAGTTKQHEPIDEQLIRHMVLNSLRSYRSKFSGTYGELVICCDDRRSWRKDVFPPYKAHRKKDREDSPHDWNVIFETIASIKQELRDNMPYKVLQVESAEADDIIATLANKYGSYTRTAPRPPTRYERILILSSDKDFIQLQKFANVYQYSPLQKKFLTTDNPERFLQEHIILGDKGDGIPNMISDDDTFIADKRQKPIARKTMHDDPNSLINHPGYKRNKTLIDLSQIPLDLQEKIIHEYETAVPQSRSKILEYFMAHKLRIATMQLSDF